jgi:hypothetical protein
MDPTNSCAKDEIQLGTFVYLLPSRIYVFAGVIRVLSFEKHVVLESMLFLYEHNYWEIGREAL